MAEDIASRIFIDLISGFVISMRIPFRWMLKCLSQQQKPKKKLFRAETQGRRG